MLKRIDLNKKAGDTINQSLKSVDVKFKKPIKVSSIKSTKTKPPVLSISRDGKKVRTNFQGEIHSEARGSAMNNLKSVKDNH